MLWLVLPRIAEREPKGGAAAKSADLWSSPDAKTWKIVQPVVEFPGRGGHTALNFKNRLWVIGGLGQKQVLNDVWMTTDSSYRPAQDLNLPLDVDMLPGS